MRTWMRSSLWLCVCSTWLLSCSDPPPADEGPTPTARADADGDGALDNADNCPEVANGDQADADKDGQGDACDGDRDGDGVDNADDLFPDDPDESADSDGDGVGDEGDAFPGDPLEWEDADSDGVGDNRDNCPDEVNADQTDADQDGQGDVCDEDRDGDTHPDDSDAFPDNPTEWQDSDGDGVGDNSDAFPLDPTQSGDSDGDGTGDAKDNCPELANPTQADTDEDGMGDACDGDQDGDGVPDEEDLFPSDPLEWQDSDGDGVGDNGDAFPADPLEQQDADEDGVGDHGDSCPSQPNPDQGDQDGDEVGDVCDPDLDGDGFANEDDAFPEDGAEWEDSDGDGVGDNSDAFPQDPTQSGDSDGDGIGDGKDNCPTVANPTQTDQDSDGIGDICDDDRDGDGTPNGQDAYPDDGTEDADTDQDGVGDNADAFPADPLEWEDSDGDGVGDNADSCLETANPGQEDLDTDGEGDACDEDRDGDGVSNGQDAFPDNPVEWQDSDGDGVGDNSDAFPNDPGESGDADGDGTGDSRDNCPVMPNPTQADADLDGQGDACDADLDGDGVENQTDVFPTDPLEWLDTDGDGVGDNADAFPEDPLEWQDTDEDSVGDQSDNCLFISNPSQANLDLDEAGDACDDDQDGDGYASTAASGTDCQDRDAAVQPGASERCDGIDNNCDGLVDEGVKSTWYQDQDGDGYGNPGSSQLSCTQPGGYVAQALDCNDQDGAIHPNASEVCDGAQVDEDCDGKADDADDSAADSSKTRFYPDGDSDGYGNVASAGFLACDNPSSSSQAYVTDHSDCNDEQASINPSASEICDPSNVDEDCDGLADNADSSAVATGKTTYYPDADQDGYGSASSSGVLACDNPSSSSQVYVTNHTDCDDGVASVSPAATELCDGSNVDEDCDGLADDADSSAAESGMTRYYPDQDQDGYGSSSSGGALFCDNPSTSSQKFATSHTDCNDSSAAINPSATESCDASNVDEDCDGLADNADSSAAETGKTRYYPDADKDTYGDIKSAGVLACDNPTTSSLAYVLDHTDCNDASASARPGGTEVANGIDDDCDGQVDEGTYYRNCRDIKASVPTSSDGTYTIDPDGLNTGLAPFQIYCDMTRDGGGWSLTAHGTPNGAVVYPMTTGNANSHLEDSRLTALLASSSNVVRVDSPSASARMFINDSSPSVTAYTVHYYRTPGTATIVCNDYSKVVSGAWSGAQPKQVNCDSTGIGVHSCGYTNGWILTHSGATYNYSGQHPCNFGSITYWWIR